MQVAQCHARIAAKPERDRWREAPALELLMIAARHIVLVPHQVEPDRRVVADHVVAVGRDARIAVAADARTQCCRIARACRLADEVDRATDRTGAGVHGVRTVDEFDLFEIERIRSRVLRAVAHAVDRDVVAAGESAQIDAVSVTAAAFAGTERDTGQRAEDIAQGQQVLFLDDLLRNDRDALRRVDEQLGVLR